MPRLRCVSSRGQDALVPALEETSKPSARRWALPVLATLVGVALLVYFLRPYGDDIREATDEASLGTLVALAGLSLLALGLRTEMWRVALRASGQDIPRSEQHAANGGTFLVSLVNGYVGPAVKMWLLRRMRVGHGPRVDQLIAVDLAAVLPEILTAAVLVLSASFFVDLSWWIPAILLAGGLVLLTAIVATHRRWDHHPAVQGLNVVMHSYYRYRLLVLLAGVFLSQIVRTWVALDAVGLDASVGSATLIFVLTGVLGALPTGLAAAPTTASVLVFGRDGVGAAAASGVLVTVALFAATILYTVVATAWYLIARRRSSHRMPPAPVAGPADSSSPHPSAGR